MLRPTRLLNATPMKTKHSFLGIISIAVLSHLLSTTAVVSAPPIALHEQNPHYFLWRGKPTILITSGEHYGAVINLDFDYARYLDELKTNHFNLARVFS